MVLIIYCSFFVFFALTVHCGVRFGCVPVKAVISLTTRDVVPLDLCSENT